MRLGAVLLAAIAACSAPSLVSYEICDSPCYTGPAGTLGVGACSRGVWRCSDAGEICAAEVTPIAEIECSGRDDDCNGKLHPRELDGDGDGFSPCAGDCNDLDASAHPGAVESCNQVDDNCDGEVDGPAELPLKLCYPGPAPTALLGECHPGAVACSRGVEACRNFAVPAAESCDTLDNDCDGTSDESLSEAPTDFVLCVDESGSMDDVIDQVKAAVKRHAAAVVDSARYALCVVPSRDDKLDNRVTLVSNFVDAGTFTAILDTRGTGYSGLEPTYDALYMIQRDEPFPLESNPTSTERLAWSPGSRRVVVLVGDEYAQSARGLTKADVVAAFEGSDIRLFVFTKPSLFADYAGIPARELSLLDVGGHLEQALTATALITCDP